MSFVYNYKGRHFCQRRHTWCMKNQPKLLAVGVLAAMMLLPALSSGSPSPSNLSIAPNMPWFVLPGRYLFTGNYKVKLSITEMRIDHMTDDTRCTRRNRGFMISAGYAQPIGNRLFSSSFELPLLSADQMLPSRLAPASVGDYVMHLSNAPLYSSTAQLLITARF
jgi:hypothetical protein